MTPVEPMLPWVLSFLRPYRGRVTILAGLLLLQVVLGALQPWPLKIVIDYALEGRMLPDPYGPWIAGVVGDSRSGLLVTLVLLGVAVQMLNQLAAAVGTQVQVDTGQRMVYDLRARLFAHIESLSLQHHVSTNTGDSVYRVDVDAYAIENLAMSGVFPLVSSTITLVVMFVILATRDLTVAVLSLSIVPFLFLSLRYYASTISVREERVKELESSLISRLYETFSAIRLVKSFAREGFEARRYAEAGHTTMKARIAITWQQSMFGVGVGAITVLGTALVLIVGGLHVMDGRMTVGDLTVVIAYLGAVYGPLSAIAHTTGQLQGALAGARRVRATLELTPEGAPHAPHAPRSSTQGATPETAGAAVGGRDASRVRGDLHFEGVGFAYGPDATILRDITFSASPGQMVAIVGLTGAGKTTLVSLIPRFFIPTTGRITLDGVDLREYDLRSLRDRIAIVPQDAVLLSGTIADNLRYGRLDASDEEVEAAARAAHAHEFVSRLPRGYQTPVAEAGASLSGGERQRLSVARAILKEAPLLILDEPTSSLDSISEEVVFAALKRLRVGRTTLVIAHRLSTVRDADAIVVLDGGRVSAHGRHDELLKSSQLYRRMCARLTVGQSLDEPETIDELIHATREPRA